MFVLKRLLADYSFKSLNEFSENFQ